MNDLFPPDFLAAIEKLSIDVSAPAPSVTGGTHLSRAAGSSLDFRDFRQYAPGDDLRRVDWNVYRRTGHLFLRRFEHPTLVPMYVMVDISASMFVEAPPRYTTAAHVTAAVTSAALRTHDHVEIVPFGDESPGPLQRLSRRSQLPRALQFLSELRPAGPGSFTSVATSLHRHARRLGVAVIVSDFFEDAGVEALTAALSQVPHRMVLVQITQPYDQSPALDRESELIDCETDRATPVFPSAAALSRYRQAYDNYHEQLRGFAGKRRCAFVRIDAAGDVIRQLERLFPAGAMHVAEALP